MQQQSVQLGDTAATQALGRRLALDWLAFPQPKPILLLEGDLGAGKTSLVQGIAQGLGIDEPITSPTFALAQHYRGQQGPLSIWTSIAWNTAPQPMSSSAKKRRKPKRLVP